MITHEVEPIQLTPAEEKIIRQLRLEGDTRQRLKKIYLRRLRTIYEFAKWLDETKCEAITYLTFCHDFGYDAIEGENIPATYDLIIDIIDRVKRTGG